MDIMRGLLIFKLAVIVFFNHNSEAVINVTLTGTTIRHVCKGEDIDFKWTYDDNNPDKNDIATIQWSKDPSGYLIMEYETGNLDITSSPNDYTGRVERTTEAGSNDIGMRLKQAGTTDVDDDGKYYVSLIVDKDPGDANDYFVPYRDPQGVQVYVCVGVDDTYPLPSLALTYDEGTNKLTCTGPSTLGDTTFAIFDPNNNNIVNSTSEVTIEKYLDPNRPGGTYRCKTYCTQQGYGETPQGTCLPTDATIFMPGWHNWSNWSSCDSPATQRTRNRTCDNPAPAENGPQNCTGVDTETEICPTPPPTGNCECHSGSSKRSINDDMLCGFSGPTFTPCSAEIQGTPNESFNCTSAMLPKGPNDSRRRRSASDRASSPGFSFNIIDENNFDMVYFRTNDQYCFEVSSFVNGTFERSVVDNDCGSYNITTDWFDVELHVSDTTVLLKLNHGVIERTLVTKHPFKPSLGLVQGPPYLDECSYDCRFSIRNISIYPAFEKEPDDMAESWGNWDAWSSCSAPATTRTRHRTCDGPQNCPGVDMETEICPTPPPTPPRLETTLSTTTTTKKVTPPPTMANINNNDGATTVQDSVSSGTISTPAVQSTTQACSAGDCSSPGTKRSIKDDTHCRFSVPTFTPSSQVLSGTPNESFICTCAMLPKGPNDLRRIRSTSDRASSPGFSFNIIDENNFDLVYFRTNDQYCFEVGSFVNGTFERSDVDNDCGIYKITTDWFDVELHVSDTTVLLKLNHGMIERTLVAKHPFKPSLGLVQGPPYLDECSYDCRFCIRNLSVYPAFEKEDDDMTEMDGFCSSPIKGGCLAMVIVCVILYLMNIYVLILICHTFVKRAHEPIARWLKVVLVCVVILVPLIGAIFVAVYVYKKHCGVKTKDIPAQEHSGKYFVFTCPCKYLYQPYEVNKDKERGRVSPCSPTPNKVQPDPSLEVRNAPAKPSTPSLSVTSPVIKPSVTVSTETSQNNHTGTGGGIGRLPPIEKVAEENTVDPDASHKKKKRKSQKTKKKREDSYQDNVNHGDATAYNHKL